jgi:adenosylcobinamide-GDP ribazoletransferase
VDDRDSPKQQPSSPLTIVALAFSFLTLFPVPSRRLASVTPPDLARSFAVFPLVGLSLGGILLLIARLLHNVGSPLLTAALLTALLSLLTRALHLDGLADVADGFGGGYTAERRLEIMKDSRTGSFGVVALFVVLAVKTSAIEVLLSRQSWAFLPLAPVLGRFAMVAVAYKSRYARKEGGLGRSFVDHISAFQILAASVTTGLCALLIAGIPSLAPVLAVLCCVGLVRFLSNRMIGGVTGDVLGAVNEIAETAAWTVFAFMSQP